MFYVLLIFGDKHWASEYLRRDLKVKKLRLVPRLGRPRILTAPVFVHNSAAALALASVESLVRPTIIVLIAAYRLIDLRTYADHGLRSSV